MEGLSDHHKKAMEDLQKIDEEFEKTMEGINAYRKAKDTKYDNSVTKRIAHKFCKLLTLGFPSWDAKIESFGEAPDCIPLFHMTCKWCGYQWKEDL